MQQSESTQQAPQNGIGEALRFPAEDAGKSLADIVRRDLDAALQLLADRAQYITGASGAAIALKRNGMNDMLCRASAGENAPELGALLSTEYGLSGESVRTRQALRCDDAEQDARVNRDVCRQLGIASVVVMPVVHDDEVLGVFELFSGKPHAFGERDLSAVQRLTEMVQTAVRLASAAEKLPGKIADQAFVEGPSVQATPAAAVEEDILDEQILEVETVVARNVNEIASVTAIQGPAPEPEPIGVENIAIETAAKAEPVREPEAGPDQPAPELPIVAIAAVASVTVPSAIGEPAPQLLGQASSGVTPMDVGTVAVSKIEAPPAAGMVPPKKKLFWSAALDSAAESAKPAESDQSHVPPVLRGLRKCEACGFPVSTGRVLCVECEEKKWRGQSRNQPASGHRAPAAPTFIPQPVGGVSVETMVAPVATAAMPVRTVSGNGDKAAEASTLRQELAAEKATFPAQADSGQTTPVATPELVLSAASAPSPSWIASNKYILIALLVAAAVIAIFLSR